MAQEQGRKEYHYATVTRVLDPKLLGKAHGAVYFKSETLTGGTEYPEPAQPSFCIAGANADGFFWVPQVGDQVEVEIDVADEHPVPKIIRGIYSTVDEPDPEFTGDDYPHVMGWVTRVGHRLIFNNKPSKEVVKLIHKIGTGFVWNELGDETKKIVRDLLETIERNVDRTVGGNVTEMLKQNVKRTVGASLEELVKGSRRYEVQGKTTYTAKGGYVMVSKSMKFGSDGSAEPLVLGNAFKALYNAHAHVGNLGVPTGEPLEPLGASQLSARAFTEL